MLPSSTGNINDFILDTEEVGQANTLTFSLDMINDVVGSKVNDLEALKQAIYLYLNVESDQYIIYSYTFGIKTIDLIGKPSHYVMAVIPDRIKEALSNDDRIINVSDFEFEVQGNKIMVNFIVHSIYGDFKEETAVIY